MAERVGPSSSTDARERAERRWVTVVLGAALAAVLVVLVVGRFELLDPTRPGTTHRVDVVFRSPCLNPSTLSVGGRSWDSDHEAPTAWGLVNGAGAIPGTLEVTERDHGVFTADAGGSIDFVRESGLGNLHCSIR